MHIVITAGPTREPIDDVRFLSNGSTGRMGIEVAIAARSAGHTVTLILGPTSEALPPQVTAVRVTTASEMRAAFMAAFERGGDACVMTAAVSDYRPKYRVEGKLKKGHDEITLDLVKNPDILREAGIVANGRPVVGFALEALPDDLALAAARGKLVDKSATLIVLNKISSLGSGDVRGVVLVTREEAVPRGDLSKSALARELVRFLEERVNRMGSGHGIPTRKNAGIGDGGDPEGPKRR